MKAQEMFEDIVHNNVETTNKWSAMQFLITNYINEDKK